MAQRKNQTKKEKGLIGVAVAVIAGAIILKNLAGKKQSLDYLDYNVSNVRLNMSNPINPVINMVVTVTNPNAAPVPVEGIFGYVFYDKTQIASFRNTTKINIGGRQSSTFNLTAVTNSITLIANLLKIFTNPAASKIVRVQGMIQTGLFEQSFTQTIPLA